MWVVCGLGNPGPEYARSRHNVGFMVVDCLAERADVAWNASRRSALVGQTRLRGDRVLLVKPLTYVNRSGYALAGILYAHQVMPAQVVTVSDDVDLSVGRLRVARKGGAGGHRGLQSVIMSLGSEEFPRIRVGIGRPGRGCSMADYVLEPLEGYEWQELTLAVPIAADAVESVVTEGVEKAMERFNQRCRRTVTPGDEGAQRG